MTNHFRGSSFYKSNRKLLPDTEYIQFIDDAGLSSFLFFVFLFPPPSFFLPFFFPP